MKRLKIKIFLGGCINVTQAQCLNCRAIALSLDKTKFEVGVRSVYSGDLEVPDEPGVRIFPVRYPAKIWNWIQVIRGILWSDVVYWTSPEYCSLFHLLSKVLRKKSFGTVEGVYSGVGYERSLSVMGSVENICRFHTMTTKTFAITKAMIPKNKVFIGLPEPDGVLYLGTNYSAFTMERTIKQLSDVALIGSNPYRKGLKDYLSLSRRFPQLRFHVIGGGIGGDRVSADCPDGEFQNVIFHGFVANTALRELLAQVQLHIFPSRAEGFPKVTLETVAAGVPSLVYDDYGADEWITSGKDGFVVKSLEEMCCVIEDLLKYPDRLQSLSDNARALAKRFDWSIRIKDWEREIERLVASD